MKRRGLKVAALLGLSIFVVGLLMVYLEYPKRGFPGSSAIIDHPEIETALVEGKPIMIYFSSIGCPTCMMQDKVISSVYPQFEEHVKFVYLLLSNSTSKVFEEWSVFKVPTIIIVDSKGKVVSRHDGIFVNEDVMKKELSDLK